jgi:hypothetical protein
MYVLFVVSIAVRDSKNGKERQTFGLKEYKFAVVIVR